MLSQPVLTESQQINRYTQFSDIQGSLFRVNQGNENPGISAKWLFTQPAPMSLPYFPKAKLQVKLGTSWNPEAAQRICAEGT